MSALNLSFPQNPIQRASLVGALTAITFAPQITQLACYYLGISTLSFSNSIFIPVVFKIIRTISCAYAIALSTLWISGRSRLLAQENSQSDFDKKKEELDGRLSVIKKGEGELKTAVASLKEILRSKKTLTSVMKMFSNLEEIEEKYAEALEKYQGKQEAFEDEREILEDLVASASQAYEYLTYGSGQFEEYESFPREDRQRLLSDLAEFRTVIQGGNLPQSDELNAFANLAEGCIKRLTDPKTTSEAAVDCCDDAWERQLKLKGLIEEIEQDSDLEDLAGELRMFVSEFGKYISEQKSQANFSAMLAKRVVAEVIEDEGDLESACSKYSESLNAFYAHMINASSLGQINWELIKDLEETHGELKGVLEQMQSACEGELDYSTPEYPQDLEAESALENAISEFHGFTETIAKIRRKCIRVFECVVERLKQAEELEAYDKTRVEYELKLIKELGIKVKEMGVPSGDLLDAVSKADGALSCAITQVIALMRRDEVAKAVKENIAQVHAGMKKYERSLRDRIESPIDDLIDLYIQFMRFENKIRECNEEVVSKKEEAATSVLKLCSSAVGEASLDEKQETAFVAYTQDDGTEKLIGRRLRPQHPIHSVLVELVSHLSKSGVAYSKYRHFVHLADRELTLFERGLFKIINKSIDKAVCTQAIYNQVAKSLPDQSRRLEYESAEDVQQPKYYEAFAPPKVVFSEHGFNPVVELKTLYGLLVQVLAFHFKGSERRAQMEIPAGHPIVCLIVSKEGEVISWGVNTIGDEDCKDPVRHAEVNALLSYFAHHPEANKLPEGSSIFTSLKPCHMCSGAIFDVGVQFDSDMKVFYTQDDPGERNTILELDPPNLFPVEHAEIKGLDEAYKGLKKKDKSLNAAQSLHKMGDQYDSLQELLLELVTSCGDSTYINGLYKHFTGLDLLVAC